MNNGTTIGRARLDGTWVDNRFITGANVPNGVAVDATHIHWAKYAAGSDSTIGRANLDGSAVDQAFITDAWPPARWPWTRAIATGATRVPMTRAG